MLHPTPWPFPLPTYHPPLSLPLMSRSWTEIYLKINMKIFLCFSWFSDFIIFSSVLLFISLYHSIIIIKLHFFISIIFYGCIWWDLPGWFLCPSKLVVNLFGFQTSLHSLIFLHQFLFLLLLRLLLLVNSISSCWIFVAPTRRIWLNTSAHIS